MVALPRAVSKQEIRCQPEESKAAVRGVQGLADSASGRPLKTDSGAGGPSCRPVPGGPGQAPSTGLTPRPCASAYSPCSSQRNGNTEK